MNLQTVKDTIVNTYAELCDKSPAESRKDLLIQYLLANLDEMADPKAPVSCAVSLLRWVISDLEQIEEAVSELEVQEHLTRLAEPTEAEWGCMDAQQG